MLSELQKLGSKVTVEEKKTSFHLLNRTAFAGVHPRKNYFILNIVSAAPINSPLVVKRDQVSKSRFHNEVKIEKATDIDAELLEWLKEAYALIK